MFELFYYGLQQDLKLLCVAPVLCLLFRAVFIALYGPYHSLSGQWRKFYHCFRYGFWWGMDWNAYVLAVSAAFVSLPGAFFPAWFEAGDTIRVRGLLVYLAVLYTAFVGKLIYYYHYRDIYNKLLWLGRNADKKNLLDIFFRQNHGALILLGYIPFLAACSFLTRLWLATPVLSYPAFDSDLARYGFNAVVVVAVVIFFYFCRFGGTLKHADKPEWDEIPEIVKQDVFLAKATVDDLVALEMVWQRPLSDLLRHSDEEAAPVIDPVMPLPDWRARPQPLDAFARTAAGARIPAPRHVFFLLAESYGQAPLDEPYASLHLADGGKRFLADPHTFTLRHFLSAGLISQPSLTSLLLGIYDAGLEFNESEAFWKAGLPTSLPVQMKALGYRSVFWYGGGLNWGSLQHFLPAAGFDAAYGAPDFCPEKAPRTWLGVYDHVFLEEAGRRIRQTDDGRPVLHLLYTTSYHGPYTIPVREYGYVPETVMPEAPAAVRQDRTVQKRLGTYWYADQALFRFIGEMAALYPDSLFLVTGDHAMRVLPFECGINGKDGPDLRERIADFFAIRHPALRPEMFAQNTIGGHMNLLPTLIELIAPAGFRYLSLFPPLTEKIGHVVTPHHWLTGTHIGAFDDDECQPIDGAAGRVATPPEFLAERDAWCELSGWIGRHPETLTVRRQT